MADLRQRLQQDLADRYAIERELGSGGMATVYLARDVRHDRRVAIKVLKPDIAALSGSERFLREIRVTAGLTHPNILKLLDSGQAAGLPFFVTPYVEGESLAQRLEREGPLPIKDALRIAREVADALDAAHRHEVVHRDIKPANILLEEGHAVVSDFGIGLALGDGGDAKLTTRNVALGTPGYMSPEQAMGKTALDGRSDLYALGCVLYEMLAGEPPYTGPSAQAIVAKQLSLPVPPVTLTRAVPDSVERFLNRALSKVPADRYQTAGEFGAALAAISADPETDSVAASGRRTASDTGFFRSSPLARLTATVSILAIASVAYVWATRAPRAAGSTSNVVVLSLQNPGAPDDDVALLTDLSEELTWQINSWRSPLVAISQASLTGAILDLGYSGPPLESFEECRSVAEAVGADSIVILTLNRHGDEVEIQAEMRGIEGEVQFVLPASGPPDDLFSLAAPITHRVLSLPGSVSAMQAMRRQSSSPAALRSYQGGRELLRGWRLEAAADAFREAIREDSAFALAYHYLAMSLYWQTARDGGLLSGLAAEISRASENAVLDAENLPLTDREHISAFNEFWRGNYDGARQTYGAILQRDPSDVFGWLMLGSVEYSDMRLRPGHNGRLTPRTNWNQAVRAFRTAVDLSPNFHLGYGHLFRIHEAVTNALDHGYGFGFELPSTGHTPPWEMVTPDSLVLFFPVLLDSIDWLSSEQFEGLDREEAARNIRQLETEWQRVLDRWVRLAPDEVRPHEELTQWALQRRARLVGQHPPERIMALARDALGHAEAALSLQSDTLPGDLERLAILHLGVDEPGKAGEIGDRSLALYAEENGGPRRRMSRGILSVLVARGQPERALTVADGMRANPLSVPSGDGQVITYSGAENLLDRLRIMGASGMSGPRVARALRELDQWLSAPNYEPSERRVLKRQATRLIAALFVPDPELVDEWFRDLPIADPIWEIVRAPAAIGDTAASAIIAAIDVANAEVADPERSYLLANAAQRASLHRLAIRLFARMDSLVLPLDRFQTGWGLRSLSVLQRAKSYAAVGDTAAARFNYDHFIEYWSEADPVVRDLRAEAVTGRDRLGRYP